MGDKPWQDKSTTRGELQPVHFNFENIAPDVRRRIRHRRRYHAESAPSDMPTTKHLHEKLTHYLEAHLPSALDLLKLMVDINSFTGNGAGVNELGRITAAAFQPLDFEPEFIPSCVQSYGDHLFLTRRGSTRRTIALVSHLDTVFPPEEEQSNNFHWKIENDRAYGPGTVDIKGGTVMIHAILSTIRAVSPEFFESVTWLVIFNAAEEDLAPNFSTTTRNLLSADTLACLVFEGGLRDGDRFALVTSRKGRAVFRVFAEGRGAHAGSKHESGVNAVVQIADTICRIAALTNYHDALTFNVGAVRGGTVVNRVPHYAEAEVEMRAFTVDAYNSGKQSILALNGTSVITSPADGLRSSVTVEICEETSPWPPNPGTQKLFAIWKKAADTIGQPLEQEHRGGLSDGNYLWDIVPTIDGLGPAGDNAHCSERSADGSKIPEYMEISSFVRKAALNALAIIALAEESS
jgi:glutamate carboxypeptidase